MKLRIFAFALLVTLATNLSAQTFTPNNSTPGTVVEWGDQVIPYVAPGTKFKAIAAGDSHTLALKYDGTVVAWGDNTIGQCSVPNGLSGVVVIAAGSWHSLALKNDGTVVAWGYGSVVTNVPAGLNGVVSISAGNAHSLALKNNGSVVAWGYNGSGETNVPAGLNGVVSISAGDYYSLALKNDGTVVAWGDNYYGETNVPVGLNNVVSIAAGDSHGLALKSNGTVVGWGYNYYGESTGIPNTNSPYSSSGLVMVSGQILSGVVAIAAGNAHSLALKSDGTVVAWGAGLTNNPSDGIDYGQSIVPAGLSNVLAIAAGENNSLALKSDGTIVAWGDNTYGQNNVPAGLSGVLAIACGGGCNMALVTTQNQSPTVFTQPASQTAQSGNNVTFTVVASGYPPPNYQWQFNGQNIPDATNATLTLNSVTAANSGGYSVVVSNPYGSVTSATASLAVLDDGANGNTPTPITASPVASKPVNAKNLIFITHGWQPGTSEPPAPQWIYDMSNAIQSKVSSDWQVVPYSWIDKAWTLVPDQALHNANIIGTQLGQQFAAQGYQFVHLIAHSAGSEMIQTIADVLKSSPNPPTIQLTFLDPYLGLFEEEVAVYGQNADWSDCYYVQDETGSFTAGQLNNAYNVDVSWVDPAHITAPYLAAGGGEVALSTHGYPYEFYLQSITDTDPSWCGTGYGFALSDEMEGVFWINNKANEPVGSGPFLPCSPGNAVQNPASGVAGLEAGIADIPMDISDAAYAVSDAGANLVGNAEFILSSISSALPLVKPGGIHPMADPDSTNTPAWLAVGVTVTNAVNFVQFDAAFTDTNSAQGLLTVYWNTNQVGMVDERVAETNLQTYRFELPGTVSGGLYTLSFRLDSFADSSSVAVTNVATGFVGVSQPITLGISITNGTPLLQLTAATNFTYLIQSSTNLADWTPTALLLNTNGTAQFMDSAVTNSGARFYRAVLP